MIEMTLTLDHFIQPATLLYRGTQYLIHWETPWCSACVLVCALVLVWAFPPTLTSLWVAMCVGAMGATIGLGVAGEGGRRACSRALARRRAPRARSILESIRAFRGNLGQQQGRLIRLNAILLKLRALFTWRDPTRTVIFLGGMGAMAWGLALTPARVVFSALLLHYFTKVLRDRAPGVVGLAWKRFWEGLPLAKGGYYASKVR
jgi:hypothetical protein